MMLLKVFGGNIFNLFLFNYLAHFKLIILSSKYRRIKSSTYLLFFLINISNKTLWFLSIVVLFFLENKQINK